MSVVVKRHKHLKLDQQKIDFAKRYFGVTSEQEAIDRALALLMHEERIVRRLKALRGALRGDYDLQPVFSTRCAAIAAANLEQWDVAARLFGEGIDRSADMGMRPWRVGLLGDKGYAPLAERRP